MRSDFAGQAPPRAVSGRWAHRDPELVVHTTSTASRNGEDGTTEGALRYTTGGREAGNTVHGNPQQATARWQGAVLVIQTWGRFGDNEIRLRDRYSCSADGHTLTLERHYEGRGRPQDPKLVLEKKP